MKVCRNGSKEHLVEEFVNELTRFLGFTSDRILFMDSPSDLPSKSIYNIEHLKQQNTFVGFSD